MRRLSRLFSRSTRESPSRLPRDQTLEDFLRSDDDSDSDKDLANGRTSVDPTDKTRIPSETSGLISAASSEKGLDRDVAQELQRRLFEAVAKDDVGQLKVVIQDIEKQNFNLEMPELLDPDESGRTALHSALEQGKFIVARHLIETQKNQFLQATYVNITKQIPQSRKSALHSAAEAGNKDLLERLLEKLSGDQTDVTVGWLRTKAASDFKTQEVVCKHDALGKRRVTAMHLAALNGHKDLILPLLSYGFDIDCEDSESETPLSLAVQTGQLDTAKFLIERKAGVDHANNYGCTPLHLAITLGRKDMVKLLLLEGNADVNAERIKSPKTPIEMAANRNELRIVRGLLKREIKLEYRHQALMIAARKGGLDIVKTILAHDLEKLLNRPDDNGNTVLMEAAYGSSLPTVKYLVGENANLHCKNHARQTVFDIAMLKTNNSLIQYLLEIHRQKKRDLKMEAFYLHVAAQNGDVKKIEYLLQSGIDFYALDERQNTFLHTAAFYNQANVLERFINQDDDIDTLKNSDGETPIHIAAKRGYCQCVEHLLKTKSKLGIVDRSGQTPLHAALSSMTVSCRIVSDLVEAIRNTNTAILNEQDILGRTALHLAAAGKRPDIVKLLTELDPEIENKSGDTPLHVAAESGTVDVLDTYLQEFCGHGKQGKIDHKDVDGFSALHRCASVADADKVELMLHHGADLALTDEHGKSVLHTMVDSYANNPSRDGKLVQVYQKIVENSTKWFCWQNDMRLPKEETKEFYLTQLDAVLLLTSGMFSYGLNAIQYASKKCANRLLLAMLNTPNVYKFCKNKPGSLTGKGLEDLNEFGSMHKQHGQKIYLLTYLKRDDVLFDVTYLVPGIMPKQESNIIGNPVPPSDSPVAGKHWRKRDSTKNHKTDDHNEVVVKPDSRNSRREKKVQATEAARHARSPMSCLELIINEGDEDSAIEVLTEAPFCSLVSNYWKMCRRTYEALMWIHVIYMICFTYFAMPSNAWLHWRFGTNSSTSDPEYYNQGPSSFYPPSLFGIFLLWPVFNLFYSLVNGVTTLFRIEALKDLISGSMIRKLKIGEITSGLLRIPIGILLFIFDNLSQISCTVFGAAYIGWYVMFIHADNAHRYLECLAMAFIFGWLHTISFVKGFKDWNAMAAILKQILLKDITRFIYIYIFILISFGYAIHAIIQADYHLDPDYRSPTSTIYLTFYRMLSPGNVLDVSESEGYKRSGGSVAVLRAVCSAYSVLSSVVLMNLLIAMMNSTYSDVRAEKSAAWRIESLKFALWVERHFPLRRLKFLRLKKTMYDKGQNRWYMTYQTDDGRNEWDTEEGSKTDTESESEELLEEQKDLEVKQNLDIAQLKLEISQIRQELETKKKEDKMLMQYISEVKSDVKLIHELCRETSQLARVGRRQE